MQKFLVLITSVLTTTSLTLSVKAEPNCNGMTPRPYVEPTTLANMAFRGAFQEQGIPSSAQLGNELGTGKVTGQDIVQAAIDSCYLSNDYGMGTNPNFARDVESQLEAIYSGG
jgi:hypothetical protein